jgi:fatty acid desaturase
MKLIDDVPSVGYSKTDAQQPGQVTTSEQHLAENRRDHSVANKLLFIALTGLLAVFAAICTTMIERGTVWRYSWLAACIVFAILMTTGIFEVGSTIGHQAPQRRTIPNRRS